MKPFICPQPGRRILYLDCSEMRQHSIEQAVQLLLALGFAPEVEYRYATGQIELILVLANQPFEHDFGDDFDRIAERFEPDCDCIHATGWPQTVPLPLLTAA
jgi:hypothetical protein